MSSALVRGRTLKTEAVEKARKHRQQRLEYLNKKIEAGTMVCLNRKERQEWRRLAKKLHP